MPSSGDTATIRLKSGRSIDVTYKGGGVWRSDPIGRPGQIKRRQSWQRTPEHGWERIS